MLRECMSDSHKFHLSSTASVDDENLDDNISAMTNSVSERQLVLGH